MALLLNQRTVDAERFTFDCFKEVTNRFAVLLILRAKRAFPFANDPTYAKGILLNGLGLYINEPADGPAKTATDMFDTCYKLGLPLKECLTSILDTVILEQNRARSHVPQVTRKLILKRWGRIPLPWVSHVEHYEDGELESRVYWNGRGVRVEAVTVSRIKGPYEAELLDKTTLHSLWRFLISVYASRKLQQLYDKYETGEQPMVLQDATDSEIIAEVEEANPVGTKGPPLKKMNHYLSQKHLAELFVMLERQGYIDQASAAVLKRAFHRTHSIHTYLVPGLLAKSSKRLYPDLFTPDFSPLFENLPPNPVKIID